MWQLKRCCFCVDLKTATLILAVCGALSHSFNAVNLLAMPFAHHLPGSSGDQQPVNQSFYNSSAIYSLFAAAFCIYGIFGVLNRDAKRLRIFAILNWFELACAYLFTILLSVVAFALPVSSICENVNGPDGPVDVEECKQIYTSIAVPVVIGVAISLLIKTHYCLAVWSYYGSLVKEEYAGAPHYYTVITSVPPPLYLAEDGFIPDVKCKEDVKQ